MCKLRKKMSECTCCSEKYTSSIRTKISCGYCPYEACKPCVSRYLLSQVTAHCMGCRTGWNSEFLDAHLTKSFRTGPWRNHLKQMLLLREKATLPNFQKYAAAKKMLHELFPKMEAAEKDHRQAAVKMNTYAYTVNRFPITASLREDSEESNEKIMNEFKIMLDELSKLKIIDAEKEIMYHRITADYNLHHDIYYNSVTKERREFIMKCVVEGCRGFLSSGYKCGLCSIFVCKDCMLVKSEKNDDSHVCRKEDIDTVTLIRKDTKPCPKCGIRISKIDGCDQMFCTSEGCATAFSWVSGKIISGTIHNPHYFEWLRRTTGSVPRTVEDGGCEEEPTAGQIHHLIVGLPNDLVMVIGYIKRCIDDIQHVRIPQYNPEKDPNMYKEFHVEYLLNNITEDSWIQSIFLREMNMEKKLKIGLILQTFHNAGLDLMRGLVQQLRGLSRPIRNSIKVLLPLRDRIADFEKLRIYINESLESLGKAIPCAVPQIDEAWDYTPATRLDKVKG